MGSASIADVSLRYLVYGVQTAAEYDQCHKDVEELYKYLQQKRCTVCDLWELLLGLQTVVARAPANNCSATQNALCTRYARRWRATEEEIELLDRNDKEKDAEQARRDALDSIVCR